MPRTRHQYLTLPIIEYMVCDDFLDARAAGAINGTKTTARKPANTVRPFLRADSTRTGVDTDGKLTIAAGQLVCAGPRVTGGATQGDPGYWINNVVTRAVGTILKTEVTITDVTAIMEVGWDTGVSGALAGNCLRFTGDTIKDYSGGTAGPTFYVPADATAYPIVGILRATGCFWYIKISGQWLLLWSSPVNSSASLYLGIGGNTAIFTAKRPVVSYTRFVPPPVCSDGMSASGLSDGLGHAEANGGAGLVTNYTVSGGTASITPTAGSELLTDPGFESWISATNLTSWTESVSGTTTVNQEASVIHGGTYAVRVNVDALESPGSVEQVVTASANAWLQISLWGKSNITAKSIRVDVGASPGRNIAFTTTYAQYVQTTRVLAANPTVKIVRNNAVSSSLYWDDASVKIFPLSSCMQGPTAAFNSENQDIDIKLGNYVAGSQLGIVGRVDSLSNPTTFVGVYFSGYEYGELPRVLVNEVSTNTWANRLVVTQQFTANGVLRIRFHDSKVWLWWASDGTTFALLNTGPVTLTFPTTNKYFNVFSTDASNTFDNLVIEPLGTNNEHAILDRF